MHLTVNSKFSALNIASIDIDSLLEHSTETFQDGRNTVKKVIIGNQATVVKKFKSPSVIQGVIYNYFRPSKAKRSYNNALKLQHLNIKTPMPIAFIEHKQRCGLKNSFYISLYHPHDFSMHEVMTEQFDHNQEQALDIIRAFTRFTYTMHEAGVLHLDHNAGNTLINKTDNGYTFSVIDINRMKFMALSPKQRLNNFVRLTDNTLIMQTIAETYADCAKVNQSRCQKLLVTLKQKHNNKLAFKRFVKKIIRR